ncbi:MAG: hypothetical protein NC181_01540 [Clostridium sp.]|nr:hypothetical protein [Clostridium sp.]MCM1444478.1 hypothetical protein [Candidatus Amulumruptor caecigallinarius]
MKKYIIPLILSIAIGVYLGITLIKQYKSAEELIPVFANNTSELYFVREGEYSSFEQMQEGMIKFTYYIHTVKNDKYYSYIGISTKKENAEKIKGYYDNLGYSTSIEVIGVSNSDFISVLEEYDKLIESSNEKTIGSICSQILSEYEELVLNEN